MRLGPIGLAAWALLACRPATPAGDSAAGDSAAEGAGGGWVGGCLEEVGRYQGEEPLVYDVDWSPGGDRVAAGSTNLLRLFSVGQGGELALLDSVYSDARYNSVQWSRDGAHLVAPTGPHVLLYSAEGDRLSVIDEGPLNPSELQRVALSPDESQLLSCDVAGVTHLYSLSFSPPALVELDSVQAHERCTRVAWSPSGRLALSAGREGDLVLYRVDPQAGGLEIADVYRAEEETGEAVFGPEDSLAVAGSFGAINDLWLLRVDPDAATMTIVQTVTGNPSGLGSLSFDRAGERLLVGPHDHSLRMYRLEDARLALISEQPDDGAGVHSGRWSPDERWVVRSASSTDQLTTLRVTDCPAL